MDAIACGASRTLLERRESLAKLARDESKGAQQVRAIPGEASEVEAALARSEACACTCSAESSLR